MPQPLFIQCLRLDLNNEKEKDAFLEIYQNHVHQRYNTEKNQIDIQIKTSDYDSIRLHEAQNVIRNTISAWHAILTPSKNQHIRQDAHQALAKTLKRLPLPKTQVRYAWTQKFGIRKIPDSTIIRITEYLYQDLLETMHTKFNALTRCNAHDCNAFFIQQGRKNQQIFCSNRCRSRIHKRQSRESPRKK